MENPYVKQYPDLMAGKTIVYVHGFASSAQSGTVRRIQETFPQAHVVARDMPLHPAEAMERLRQLCASTSPDLVIGTSMGGMYAEMLTGYDRILVNPAFQMGDTLHDHNLMGKQAWTNPREDGETEFLVTKSLVKEYKEMTERCFSHADEDEQRHVYGLFGDEDPLVHTFGLFHSHYRQAIHFHGGHQLDDRVFLDAVVPVVRWIDDRQEGRGRSIVYIDSSTLKDDYGHPKASLQKAFKMLVECYQVFVVAPAPTEDPAVVAGMQAWVRDVFDVPAWNRVVFCNDKSLLYGDYLIDCRPAPDFLGTTVAFGSDGMKTWDDVITFFGRLGGQ